MTLRSAVVDMTEPPTHALREPWTLFSPQRRWFYLAILFLVSTSNYIDRQVVSILIEPIKAEFGVSDTMMGLLSGFAFALVYGSVGIPLAWLSDRSDRKLIIALSVTIWSVMTACCGLAGSFPQLLTARAGVGLGEAGANPPAQSLIADYFPPTQRARALSIFMASSMIGYVLSFVISTHIAAAYGWRTAFVALGLPGILLALLTLGGLREPRRVKGYSVESGGGETLLSALRALVRKPSYLLLVGGMSLYFFVSYGSVIWFPSYMIRILGAKMTEMGSIYGTASAVAAVIGTIGGGILTDRLAARDVRWIARVPAFALLAICPLYLACLVMPTFTGFVVLCCLGNLGLEGVMPALFTAIHRVCGSARRATAIAIALFLANVIGLGGGAGVAGALSDVLSASYGVVGLRYALMAVTLILIPSSVLVWCAADCISQDSEN